MCSPRRHVDKGRILLQQERHGRLHEPGTSFGAAMFRNRHLGNSLLLRAPTKHKGKSAHNNFFMGAFLVLQGG